MRLYPPVNLTGNVSMIEKLVLGGTGTGDLPILSPTRSNPFITLPDKHMLTFQTFIRNVGPDK